LCCFLGCGDDQVVQPAAPGGAAAPAATPVDPLALVGSWRVTDASGEEQAAVLRLARDLSLWRQCGWLMGAWRASPEGLFVAHVSGGSGDCASGGSDLTPEWMRAATRYRVETDARVLLDERGDVVARLLPGGRPTPGPDIASSAAEPPVVTDDLRKQLAPAAALPRGLEPAEKARLVGRWVPVDGAVGGVPQAPHVLLTSEGDWSGSDGCNAQGGRWTAGAGGSLLAVAGPQTLVGCAGANVGGWLSGASRAGFDGAVLVLLDSAGQELGRLKAQGG
jgi:hypothetical protein